MKLVTGAAMKAIDHEAIHTFGIPGIVLMENAGRAVAEEILKLTDASSSAVIVCGRGNNGGDGYVIARALVNAGWQVKLFVLGGTEGLQGDSHQHFCIANKLNIPCMSLAGVDSENFGDFERTLEKYEFLVDAMMGTGLNGEVSWLHKKVFEKIKDHKRGRVISVDLPSGINSDTGAVMGSAIKADLTVTLAAPKLGNILYPGFLYGGELIVKDIGIPFQAYKTELTYVQWIRDADVARLLPKRQPDSHKGTYGKVCLIAGLDEMGGAAVLAAQAVLRAGAGLIKLFVAESLKSSLLPILPEAIVRTWDETTLDNSIGQCATAQVTAVGPGCGQGALITLTLTRLLSELETPLVIDADGLNTLAQPVLLKLLKSRKFPTLLTPHPAEMSRLTGLPIGEITADPVTVARKYAEIWGVVLVLKGARTTIADGDGQVYISSAGNSGMATAGSGDVLTGIISSLIAQGLDPFSAAIAGVHLHGAAGDVMEAIKGEHGLISGDLIEGLPDVFKRLE